MPEPQPKRCAWARGPLLADYHDREWGVPLYDDRRLFELLTLEGAQAGLSWEIVLRKRDGYRRAFADFDPARVARFTPARVARLLADPGIVRNRRKIDSTIGNARALLALVRDEGSLARWLWTFTDGQSIVNRWKKPGDVPAETDLSRRLSRELKKRGFGFVGPTVCYAFLQAAGLVNDHTLDCFRHPERAPGAGRKRRP